MPVHIFSHFARKRTWALIISYQTFPCDKRFQLLFVPTQGGGMEIIMAITKIKNENSVTYLLGNEKVLVADFEQEEKTIIKINGAIKTLVAPCLEEVIKFAMEKNEEFSIDFSEVTYIASAGLRVLLNMQQEIDENDKPDVIIINVQDNVKEVFEQTGFNNILSIEE